MRKTENIINRTGINKTECKKTGHSKENKIPGVKCTPKIELYLSNFKGALHWWNGSLFFLIIILGITLGIFAGCKNIFVPEPPATPEAAGPGGGITVSLRLFTGSARSVMPGMKDLTWEITATSDGAEATVLGEYPEFKIYFPFKGTWDFVVKGKSGTEPATKEIFTGKTTMEITGSTTSISIPLSPGDGMRDGSGAIELTMTVPTDVTKVKYKLDGESGFTDLSLTDGSYSLNKANVSAGIRTLSLYFLDDTGMTVYMCTETVNVWNGVTSNQWVKTSGADHINEKGQFILRDDIVASFVDTMGSVVFVDANVKDDEPATGSFFAPVKTVSKAVDILRKVNEGNTQINGTIVVSGAITIDQEIKVKNGETLTIKGRETGASIKNTSGRVFNITGGSLTLGENITLTGTNDAGNGGAVYVNGGSFTMESGSKITGSSAEYGGGVYVDKGTFTMGGGTISKNIASGTGASGGGVCISGGTFTMSGGAVISKNTATSSGGGVFVSERGDFTMKGGAIGGPEAESANSAENGGGVYIHNGTFTMSGSAVISGNNASGSSSSSSGGGVYVGGDRQVTSTFTMRDRAVISGNSATSSGGGVYVYETGEFTMEGGTIGRSDGASANSSKSGGGVCVYKGTFTMNDGIIGGISEVGTDVFNHADVAGGGVYVYEGYFTMSDGSISGNTATGSGGGVYVDSGTFTVSGSSPVITNNTANNVYLTSGNTITIGTGGLTDGTIGVTAEDMVSGGAVQITNGDVNGAAGIFTSDMSDRAVHSINGNVYMVDTTPENAPEVAYFDTNDTTNFDTFERALVDQPSNITLLQDITPTTATGFSWPITFDWTCTLDLNGYTINRGLTTGTDDGQVIVIVANGNVTIKDSSATNSDGTGGTGKITGGNSRNEGGGVYVAKDGTFIMNGGIISKNTTGKNGGGVYVNAGTFTMDGGTISGNKAGENGGGVSVVKDGVTNRGKFTMNGGAISGNTATQNGGGVNIADIFTMNGGTISGNKAGENGGGVNIGGGNFTMIGGTISGNTATQNGGGVYAPLADTGYFWLGEEGKTSSPVISGNKKADGTHNNAYLFLDNRNRYMNINGPLQKTKSLGNVGISMDNPGRFTVNWTKNSGLTNPDFFFSDKEGYGITGEGGELKMAPLSEIP